MSKNENIFVKPAKDGLIVPRPDGTDLKAKGDLVKNDSFWQRRILDGDVVVVDKNKSETTEDDVKTSKKGK